MGLNHKSSETGWCWEACAYNYLIWNTQSWFSDYLRVGLKVISRKKVQLHKILQVSVTVPRFGRNSRVHSLEQLLEISTALTLSKCVTRNKEGNIAYRNHRIIRIHWPVTIGIEDLWSATQGKEVEMRFTLRKCY